MARRTFKRALFIRFGGLGDILMETPMVRALAKAHPGIEIDFMVGSPVRDVLTGHPNVRKVFGFHKRGQDVLGLNFLKWCVRVHRERYDLVLNMQPSVKTYFLLIAALPKKGIVYQKTRGLDRVTGRSAHAVDDCAKELRKIGIDHVPTEQLDFFVADEARQRIEETLRAHSAYGLPVVVLNPGASQPVNRWSAENFRNVASQFAGRAQVVVLGAPGSVRSPLDGLNETELASFVAGNDPRVLNVAGKLTIKELGAMIARADVFLTCDTGPMHIASALHTPTVALFGAADPDRSGPLNPHAIVLSDSSLSCLPCRKRYCFRGDIACMTNLSVSRVVESMQELLQLGPCMCSRGDLR